MRCLFLISIGFTTVLSQKWFDISVVGDATYSAQGPICSGNGILPAGTNCPSAGDVAVADCHSNLPSFSNGNCVAPRNATCQKIPSGAWGCVWAKPCTNTTSEPITTTAIPITTYRVTDAPTDIPTEPIVTEVPPETTDVPTSYPTTPYVTTGKPISTLPPITPEPTTGSPNTTSPSTDAPTTTISTSTIAPAP